MQKYAAELCLLCPYMHLYAFICTKYARYVEILYPPSQPHRGDQAGLAHTVKAAAFPIPSGGEGLVYSLNWCWDQGPSIAGPRVERLVSER